MTTRSDIERINTARDLGLSAFNARDVERFIGVWVDDEAIFMLPNEPAIIGKEAVRKWLQDLFEQFDVEQTVISEELVVFGDWAFNRVTVSETFTPKGGGRPMRDLCKAIDIYRRQADGSWKAARTIINSNMSPRSVMVEK